MIEEERTVIDLDRDRIRTVLTAAYSICKEFLQTDFSLTESEFVSKIDPYLNSNRVTIPVQLNLHSRKFPELLLEVDLRQKKIMARMASKTRQATLNHMLKAL